MSPKNLPARRTFNLERLEARQLMAGDIFLGNGLLAVWGTNESDVITVTQRTYDFDMRLDRFTIRPAGTYVQATIARQDGVVLNRKEFLASTVTKLNIDGLEGNDRIENNTSKPSEIRGGQGMDVIYGGQAADVIYTHVGINPTADPSQVWGVFDYANGGEGDDTIHGSNDVDELQGSSGNDTIFGYWGGDIVVGGSGKDTIDGGYGNDDLTGGSDNDTIQGSYGNDILHGGSGNDDLDGGWGQDEVFGGSGNDMASGSGDNDYLEGGSGNDILWGNDGNDELFGNDDDDRCYGGSGDDFIQGGIGDDFLAGEWGFDTMWGDYENNPYDNSDDLIYFDMLDSVEGLWGSVRWAGSRKLLSGTYEGYAIYEE